MRPESPARMPSSALVAERHRYGQGGALGPDGSAFDVRAAVTGGYAFVEIPSVPLIAIPTTAGTGSEVTPTATIWDDSTRRKHSIGSSAMFPTSAIIDPGLAVDLDWPATLGPGLDAYVQCFEAIWNVNASRVPSLFATWGLRQIPGALEDAPHRSDGPARTRSHGGGRIAVRPCDQPDSHGSCALVVLPSNCTPWARSRPCVRTLPAGSAGVQPRGR